MTPCYLVPPLVLRDKTSVYEMIRTVNNNLVDGLNILFLFLFFIENQGLFLLKKKKRKENVLLVWKYSLKFDDDKGGV